MKKYDALIEHIQSYAFSGGVDSTFLLKAAVDTFGKNSKKVLAITIKTPYIPAWEIEEAKEFAASLGVEQVVLEKYLNVSIKNNGMATVF